ncbi:hypothetical protein DH2020_013938 [Rehmannia glutinosa]|uniref:Ribosomal RNA-processing protein 43 n=1 Tax=Rehmannia glutinosa TaxID=99300 RepID=A0ABR0WUX8_REHGL
MAATSGVHDLSSEMEVDAFRRLFPLRFHERHLLESIRPDGGLLEKLETQPLCLTMLAAIKMEVMTPTVEAPEEGCIGLNKCLSGMIDLKELCLVGGKAAWMVYLDIYCLDADGALFDAALLSAVAAFSHCKFATVQIPVVSLNDDGRIVLVSEDNGGAKKEKEPVNKDKRKLKLNSVPFSLTCILHKDYILADPTSEEESIMETYLTVVLDSSFQLVSFNKPGGPGLANTSAIQKPTDLVTAELDSGDCVTLTRQRVKELQKILNETISDMEVD